MTARDPNVRRALVTQLSDDGSTAKVLVEWMRMMRQKDKSAIQGETPEGRGVDAEAIDGLQVGDEVLVDLRPLPVVKLSFLFFMLPLLLFGGVTLVIHLAGEGAALRRPLILGLQILLGAAAGYGGYRYADHVYQGLRDQGLGTPRITAVMPRFVGEVEGAKDPKAAYLQAVFFLTAPVPPETWEFASAEFERISGIREAKLRDDRVEVVFQNGVVKEKHVLELLTMFGFQLALDREMDLDAP